MNLGRKTLLLSLAAMMVDMGRTIAKVHNEEPNKRGGYRSASKSTFTPEQKKKRNKNKASKKARKKNRK